MNDPVAANRDQWAERLPYHLASDFYDVERFKAGAPTLRSIELDEVGDVAGIALLHLQCHFGLDTLSWARRGARVTGVDFSPPRSTRAGDWPGKRVSTPASSSRPSTIFRPYSTRSSTSCSPRTAR